MILATLKWDLTNTTHGIMRIILRIFYTILELILNLTLFLMVLTCPAIQYPIKVISILVIWKIILLMPTIYAELIVRHRQKREVHDSLFVRAFPKHNIILTHYMLITWWLHLMYGLGHYAIHTGAIAQILLMNNNTMILVCTYANLRIKNPPTFSAEFHISAG